MRMWGRIAVNCYYGISPVLVRFFGNKEWFRAIWKAYLDKKINKLKVSGYSNAPYADE